MLYYYFNCRSLTYAQRTAKVLERAGLSSNIRRTPKSIAGTGCGYSVRVSSRHFAPAIQQLDSHQMMPKQIYLADGNGEYREVTL